MTQETITLEQQLRPAPGVPVEIVRAQVEAIQHLQQAVMAVVSDGLDPMGVCHYAAALSTCTDTLFSMTAPAIDLSEFDVTEIRHLVSEGVEIAFAEHGPQ